MKKEYSLPCHLLSLSAYLMLVSWHISALGEDAISKHGTYKSSRIITTVLRTKSTLVKATRKTKMANKIFRDLDHPFLYEPFMEKIVKAVNFANSYYFQGRVRISETYRTLERQRELYGKGRTKKGKIVTKAKPGESLHGMGVAVDLFIVRFDGSYEEALDPYKQLEGIMVQFGVKHLRWADYGHYEVATNFNLVKMYKECVKKGMKHHQAIKYIHEQLTREMVFFKGVDSGLII